MEYDGLFMQGYAQGVEDGQRMALERIMQCARRELASINDDDALGVSPLESIGLTERTLQALKRDGLTSVAELYQQTKHGMRFKGVRNIGPKREREIADALKRNGFPPVD